ncbi:hypothetical protein OESDEN_13028 [Oesophagostomum dentatum]|uniref:Trypsin Inhibitor like cysteine rich domain protein n=1 Tax=Oesophagostomum dentatum TaxID=61180 RepID=A0A0B1SUL7_OESDE|nr:hypothetical protein OESDEN_13028 [Oesophagostomum dentatum]
MIAILVVGATLLFHDTASQAIGKYARDVFTYERECSNSANVLNCNNVRCAAGNKCVMAEPQGCVGCPLRPRCVQQQCNTGCASPCRIPNRCVLVATNCCPNSACRAPATTTRRPPIFTIPTWRPWPFAAEGEASPVETTKTPE